MNKPNIGLINAIVRITFGLTILAWTTAKMVKRPWRESYFWVSAMAAMKVAEGITRFCPLTALFNQYKENLQSQNQSQQKPLELAEDLINPS